MRNALTIAAAIAFAMTASAASAQDADDDDEAAPAAAAPATPSAAATAIPTSNDLAIRPVDLEALEVAGGEYGFDVSQKSYDLEIGQAYTLTIESPGVQECQWRAPDFFENIYIRKIEVGGVEVKARTFEELEFGDGEPVEAELFFVPIRPGTFAWECRNLAQRDVVGEFVVK